MDWIHLRKAIEDLYWAGKTPKEIGRWFQRKGILVTSEQVQLGIAHAKAKRELLWEVMEARRVGGRPHKYGPLVWD
jgi:hypothetical protein